MGIFSQAFPKMRNLPKIFLRHFANVAAKISPNTFQWIGTTYNVNKLMNRDWRSYKVSHILLCFNPWVHWMIRRSKR